MDWRIFSAQEVGKFLEEATEYGLASRGENDLTGSERAISCGNRDYTFAWLALQKSATQPETGK